MRFPGRLFLGNLIERRTLLFQMVRRDFRTRFVGSVAGWLWGVIHPLVMLASWTFVFNVCLKMQLGPEEVTQNYSLYLFAGFLPWMLFQDTVHRSSTCLLDNANLITKTMFPSEVVPLSIFLSSLIHHLIGVLLVVAAAAVWLRHASVMIGLLPLYIFCVGLLAVGIGWVAAALQVYLRDTAQVVAVATTFWFWITPIFISETQYPSWARVALRANPMAYVVRAYRERLLSSRPPDLAELAVLAAAAGVVFVAGGLFFRHLKRGFADVL